MKKIFLLLFLTVAITSVKSQATYFQAQVKKSASGTNLEFYIRPNPTGSNLTLKFDNFDFFVRWPNTDAAPVTGTPIVNTVDFPGLTIAQQTSDDPYGSESGFTIREWVSPSINSTTTAVTYVAGQDYLVFSVPVSNAISDNIQLSANNEDGGAPYLFSVTKNISGIGGQSDFTSHNSTNGDINNQLFYSSTGTLSQTLSNGFKNFYQQVPNGILTVKFTSFNAIKKDANAVLTWTVENETAVVDHYEIERSLDGLIFNKIDMLPKSSNTNTNIYNYTDPNLSTLNKNGIIYYRIKQIDLDGKFVYSAVKNIKNTDRNSVIAMYPNPVKDITVLQIDAPEKMKISYELLSINGKILQTSNIDAVKGINTKMILMGNYTPGNYLLKITMGSEMKTIKVVKE